MKAILIAPLLIAALLAACAQPAIPTAAPEVMEAPAATEAPAALVEVETIGVSKEGSVAVAPTEASQEAYPAQAPVSGGLPSTGAMVIKDALLELLVQDTHLAMERIIGQVADQGGYVISSRTWIEGKQSYAELHLGIPSKAFENTLNAIRHVGIKVLNEQVSGQDVSAEYADLRSRLANLEATSERVRAFLGDAKTVEESLKINQTLSDLEGQIEQIKGQMKFYEGRAAYSTLTVTLKPQPKAPDPTPTPTPTPVISWDPGRTAKQASHTVTRMYQGIVDLLIWVGFLAGPFAVVALVGWVVYRLVRRQKRPMSG